MPETPQPNPEDFNAHDQARIDAEFRDIISNSFSEDELQSKESGEILTKQEQLIKRLRDIAPDEEYDPKADTRHSSPEHVLYVEGDPKHKIIVRAASGRHNVNHTQGRKNEFYWAFHNGRIDQMHNSDLPSALTPDLSLDTEQAAAQLLELLDRSSPDKPEKTRRMFGGRVLSRLVKHR